MRFSDDIFVCLQILNFEFANAIYALVCLPVKLQHQYPLNVLHANNIHVFVYKNMFKIFKAVANLELMPI